MKTYIHEWARVDNFFLKAIGRQEGIKAFEQEAGQLTALPCPFCGGEAAAKVGKSFIDLAVNVYCTNCGITTKTRATGQAITGDIHTVSDRLAQTLAEWNRRTQSPPQSQSAER